MEQWKDVPGYEGHYEASTDGRIRSKLGRTSWDSFHGTRTWKQKELKPKCRKRHCASAKLEPFVDLWKNGKHRTINVARVVAMTWCDGYQPGLSVNHKDGNPMNNNACNLEWLSIADNIRDGFRTGLFSKIQKPCTLVNEAGEEFHFASKSDASRFLGRCHCYVGNQMLANGKISSVSGEKYVAF